MSALGAWLRDPEEIYRRSFAIIHAETPLDGLPPALAEVAVRIGHAGSFSQPEPAPGGRGVGFGGGRAS